MNICIERQFPHVFHLLIIQRFHIRPRTPSDPREVYITVLQEIPEIAHIFSLGVTKQSE